MENRLSAFRAGASFPAVHSGRARRRRSSKGHLTLAYIEYKNVLGLTVWAEVTNLVNACHCFDRDVYSESRDRSPLAFRQHADQLIGPIKLVIKDQF